MEQEDIRGAPRIAPCMYFYFSDFNCISPGFIIDGTGSALSPSMQKKVKMSPTRTSMLEGG